MRRFVAFFLALTMLLTPCLSLADEQLDETIRKLFKSYKTTGGALYVAKDGEIVYQYLYGWADKKDEIPVTEDTYFRTASVTKMISAIHVMQLVEQGLLDLDENIGTYLGYTVQNPKAKNAPLTLRHLMSHTCALNSRSGYSNTNRTLASLLDGKKNQQATFLKRAPGSKYEYSNFGAGIMGSLVEAVTGKNVNDSVTESFFQPLGIDAADHPSLLSSPDNIASIYSAEGKRQFSRKSLLARDWDPGVDPEKHFRITVGGLWAHPRDLCRIGMLLCQGGTLDGVTILQPETIEMMQADQNGQPHISVSSPYGLCVNRMQNLVKGRMIYGHQGLVGDTVCNIYYDPDTQFVFALVTNGSSTGMNDRIVKLSRKTFAQCWITFSGSDDKPIS